jgi:hypothetical protein
MTDRELLELAAKAAGLIVWQGQWPQDEMLFASPKKADPTGKVTGVEWNPLTDDGDALRLAAALKLSVCHTLDDVPTAWGSCIVGRKPWDNFVPLAAERYEGDSGCLRMSATRRAIVRAAVAIGAAE